MIRRVFVIGLATALSLVVIGCAAPSAAPVVAPQAGQATTAAPAVGKRSLPLPPQPTVPAPAPGAPYAWQTAVPAIVVSGPPLAPASSASAATAPTVAATQAVATVQPTTAVATAAAVVATAPGVATGKKTDAKFTFTPALATIEETEPLDAAMKHVPGILEAASGQTSTVVTYDAGLITLDQIAQAFALQGHPVKPQ